jgi:hypothetical protein
MILSLDELNTLQRFMRTQLLEWQHRSDQQAGLWERQCGCPPLSRRWTRTRK